MNKQDVISFFDRLAPVWDDDTVRNEPVIAAILDKGGIRPGIHVLDVACGTGVLFGDYLSRGVSSLTAIDLSPNMAAIAQRKFPEVSVLCGDVEETVFPRKFDAVMVYNAFPHFPDPARLVAVLSDLLAPGGRLTIAHGMSRAALAQHHKRARKVSIELLHEDELAALMSRKLRVDVKISDHEKYIVSGFLPTKERVQCP